VNCSSIMEIPLKSSLLLLIFAAPLLAFSQSKADYTIPVHVLESHIGLSCDTNKGTSTCKSTQVLTAQVEGKKYQLQSETFFSKGLVALGDYSAKLGDHKEKPTGEFTRSYSLMFPDGSTRTFNVIGQSE
jgi:hypothetical protein